MDPSASSDPNGPVDVEHLREMADKLGGPGIIVDLIDILLEEAPKHLATIEEGLETGGTEDVGRAAHTLKSSAGQVGASELQARCLALEKAAKEGAADDDLERLAREIVEGWEEARPALQQVRDDLGAAED